MKDKIEEFIRRYPKGMLVFPAVLCRALDVDKKTAYGILYERARSGEVAETYQIVCPRCGYAIDALYQSAGEIPETVNCQNCDYEIDNALEYARVLFRKR